MKNYTKTYGLHSGGVSLFLCRNKAQNEESNALPPFQMEGKDVHWHFVGFPLVNKYLKLFPEQRPCHAAVRALCTAHTMLSATEVLCSEEGISVSCCFAF